MTWVRLDDQLPDHPKAEAAGGEAMWLFTAGLCYCGSKLTDGKIPKSRVARLTDLKRPQALADRLCAAGLWHDRGDFYEVHDYHDYQRSKAEVDELSAKRAEAGKKGGKASATVKQVAKQTAGKAPPRGQRDRETDTKTDDDAVDPAPPADGLSSSEDADRSVWLAYAELVADAQAEPPAKRSAYLTSVSQKAKRERHTRLTEYLRVHPSASTDTLARWLFDDVDPVMIDRPELDPDFTPAADLKVVGQ